MNKQQILIKNAPSIMENLEQQIKNNFFSQKEDLINYIYKLRNNGVTIDEQKIKEMLQLFDSLHKIEEPPLDMQKYASISLENQDLIISKETDRVLQTLEGQSSFNNEFKQTQNEIVANNKDGLVNADTVFKHMANYQKEEMNLIPLTESMSLNNINIEILEKINFFITNIHINQYLFKVDIKTGFFYNIETDEVYEVRKNKNTQQYEIFKAGEKVYGSNDETLEEPPLEYEKESEQIDYESGLNKPKVRVRKLDEHHPYMNNAAFTKIGFLAMTIISYALITIMILLLNKK